MNKVGLMRIGAMLATLLVVIGGLAVQPYWNARAETMTVWGIVRECNATGPVFLQGVTVTLLNARSTDNYSTSTSADGYYSFSPPTGSYYLRLTSASYYTKELGVFRFDGSVSVRKDTCFDKMPTRTNTLTVLVVGAVSTAHPDEPLTFTQHYVDREQTQTRWDPATGTTTTSHSPVVYPTSLSVTYKSSTVPSRRLDYGVDYTWSNLYTGVLKVLNSVISADLNASTTDKWLNVTYRWSDTSTRLLFYPVVPSSYTVYKNGSAWMAEGTDWTLNVDTGVFRILGNFVFGTDTAKVEYSSTGVIPSATVNLFNATRKQIVANGFTNSTGYAVLSIWPAVLELQVTKDQYQASATSVDTNTTTNWTNPFRVVLQTGVQVFGHAFRTGGGPPINTGVVGYLYNTNVAASPFRKVISAKVQGSLYIFYAEAGQYYKMVIDADGYRASETFVSTASGTAKEVDATLAVSLKEEYRTVVTYDDLDWNKLTIDRRLTLRPDSSIPGLLLPGIRSLGLQIDYTLGDKNGNLTQSEVNLFGAWLLSRLPDYVTTSGFLGTNGVVYNSTASSYVVSPVDVKPTLIAPAAVFINTTATYTVSSTVTVPNQKDTYYVNITTPNDTNTTVYQNRILLVDLPRGYEMTSKKVTGTITTTNWTAVTVDPGVASGSSTIDMTVRESRNGSAAAMVTGPAGKFYVYDDTKTNYTAIVAKDTNITFSASQSTDPVGDIKDANFTWQFKNTTVQEQTRWGMDPTYNYTSFGRYTVNLTVVEAGKNKTYRDIHIYVDDTSPVAVIQDNKTSPPFGVNVNGTTLRVNEDSPVRFDGSASSDIIFTGADLNSKIKIPDVEGHRGYEWDFDGDGVVDSYAMKPIHSFEKPGRYNMTLTVVDWVGHRSVPARLTMIVNDTTKPVANFIILDPADDWAVVSDMMEKKSYAFNASSSSDNYDSNANLTYAWHFPGPVSGIPTLDSNGNFSARGATGWNITVTWAEFNTSYNITLTVTDTGFGSNTPNSGNTTMPEPVAVDPKDHPDLKIVSNSLRIEPGQPEENQAINVSFAIQNLPHRKNATHVRIILYVRDANGNLVALSDTPEWRTDKWDPVATKQIPTGEKVRLIFTISFPSQGNRTLEIHFNDTEEPYTWVDSSNKVTGGVFVRLAGWVLPAVAVVVIVLIVLVAFGLRAYGRYKAGEPIFPRREKKEKGKKKLEEEEEEEEEAEEEDKRGKKRL